MTSSRVSRRAAANELLRRRRGRSSLLDFTKYTYPRYMAEPAHELIAREVQWAAETPNARLMIFAPPQHGKSELVSVRLPAFALGTSPDAPVILASYGASLAQSKSRQARAIVEGAEFSRLWPSVSTNPESRAVDNWTLAAHRGGMLAVGVGGPVTGHGTRLGIIDDPIENWEQAHSETYRKRIWEWYRGTFRTRIWENGSIVLIMTRWHVDDLAGRLLQSAPGAWRVLRLPALAETQDERDAANARLGLPTGQPDPLGRSPGDALCPLRYSAETLAALRTDVGGMAWAAEYQGIPNAPEGTLAQRDWFPIVDAAPADARAARFWDLAATAPKAGDPDWTTGTRMSVKDGIYYVEHVVRGRWGPGGVEAVYRQTAEADGRAVAVGIEQEPGSSGKLLTAALVRMLAGWNVRAYPATGDKITRAMPFVAQAEAGNVRLVRGAWNEAWLDEITAVPNAPHDDQWDGAAGAFAMVMTRRRLRPA